LAQLRSVMEARCLTTMPFRETVVFSHFYRETLSRFSCAASLYYASEVCTFCMASGYAVEIEELGS
ncbi:hypothetical protein ABLN68_00465, partial [Mycobacterium tuberculosis]